MSLKAAFYILTEPTPKARDLYACRVIEKAFSNGQTVYVHAATVAEAQSFDVQLWTFRDISFVPHEIYNQNLNSAAPVLIGYDAVPTGKKDILINLTSETPSFYQQFDHIIEVIPNDANLKAAARKRYQVYQSSGYKIEIFNIRAPT
ncbi:DNA polymerase III subunit chi [Gammaproteobacteria bacterium]